MNGFSTILVNSDSEDGHHFIITKEFSYTNKAGAVLVIPVGTQTDGASTPHALWPTLPPFGKYWKATILHDRLYRYENYPKPFCDLMLYEAMQSLGVDSVTEKIIYEGVVLGGQSSFDEDRKTQGEPK